MSSGELGYLPSQHSTVGLVRPGDNKVLSLERKYYCELFALTNYDAQAVAPRLKGVCDFPLPSQVIRKYEEITFIG